MSRQWYCTTFVSFLQSCPNGGDLLVLLELVACHIYGQEVCFEFNHWCDHDQLVRFVEQCLRRTVLVVWYHSACDGIQVGVRGQTEETGRKKKKVSQLARIAPESQEFLHQDRWTTAAWPLTRATVLLTCFRVPGTLSSSPALGIPLEPPNYPLLPV